MNEMCYFVICPLSTHVFCSRGVQWKKTDKTQRTALPTYTLLDDAVNGKFCLSPPLRFLDGNMAGLGGLSGPFQPGCSRTQLPDPTNRNPVSVLAQPLDEPPELAACALEVLPHQHGVHQVPVVLVYEGGRGRHLSLLFILQGKGQLRSNRAVHPQIRTLQPASWAMFQPLILQ